MRIVVGVLLLLGAALLQVTLLARIDLLQGTADAVLLVMVAWMLQDGNRPDWRWGIPAGLMIGYASALPGWLMLAGYIAASGLCQLLHTRVWQVRLLTQASGIFAGTLVIQLLTLLYMWIEARPLGFGEAFNLVMLPSLLLNLILLLPVNALISELNKFIAPAESE
jgi:hypothetical protein